MEKKFSLTQFTNIIIEKQLDDKEIWKEDIDPLNPYSKRLTLLATLDTNSHKWSFVSPNFFELVKQHSSVFKNNLFKPMLKPNEISFEKQFECFKRRVNISVTRTLNKIRCGSK